MSDEISDFGSAATHVAQALASRDAAKRAVKRLQQENAELIRENNRLLEKNAAAKQRNRRLCARYLALLRRFRELGNDT